jgi:putative cell wall-binding protein
MSGENRFATGAALAERWEPGVERVFLATGGGFADALAAVPIAGMREWPILLVEEGRIPDETAAALQRLEPQAVTVLGGTAAISDAVATMAAELTGVEVDRVAGASRFDTAAALAARFVDDADVVFVATGAGFADSLAIGAAAVAEGGPLLLTMADTLPSATVAQLERLSPQRIVVVGGEAVITPAVAAALGDLAPEVVRWAGADRYGTSAAIVREAFPGSHPTVWMATGEDYPDALVGGVSAGIDGAPLVAVRPDCVPAVVMTEVDRMSPDTVMVLGGPSTVGDDAAGLTSCATAPPE